MSLHQFNRCEAQFILLSTFSGIEICMSICISAKNKTCEFGNCARPWKLFVETARRGEGVSLPRLYFSVKHFALINYIILLKLARCLVRWPRYFCVHPTGNWQLSMPSSVRFAADKRPFSSPLSPGHILSNLNTSQRQFCVYPFTL